MVSVQDTSEIRELADAELELVAGGSDDIYDWAAVVGGIGYGALFSIPAYVIGNVGVLKHLDR
jgi:hypothetical protein